MPKTTKKRIVPLLNNYDLQLLKNEGEYLTSAKQSSRKKEERNAYDIIEMIKEKYLGVSEEAENRSIQSPMVDIENQR